MQIIPEYAIAGALGTMLLLFLLSRFLNNRPGYLSRKNELLEKFQSIRARSHKLQQTLSSFILSNHVESEFISGETTFSNFLRQMQKNHIQNLSDKNYARIKNTNNRIVLKQANQMLEEQETILKDAEEKTRKALGRD